MNNKKQPNLFGRRVALTITLVLLALAAHDQLKSGSIDTPSGYRPPNIQVHAVASNAAFGYLDISTAGVVRPLVGNTAWVSLDGITFRV